MLSVHYFLFGICVSSPEGGFFSVAMSESTVFWFPLMLEIVLFVDESA